MRAYEIAQNLTARGFALALAVHGIEVSPATRLLPADVEVIKAHRDELIRYLRRQSLAVDPADPIVLTVMPATQFIFDLVEAGQLPEQPQAGYPMPVLKWPERAANPEPVKPPPDAPRRGGTFWQKYKTTGVAPWTPNP
jgi:hypothetical protein